MRFEEIDPLPPETAATRLRPLGKLVFLDSAMRHETLGRYSFVTASPFATFTVDGAGAMLDGERLERAPLEALDDILARHRCEMIPSLPPFQGGAAGFIAYEFAHHLERLPKTPDYDPARPVLSLGLYDTVLAYDHRDGRAFLVSTGRPAAGSTGETRAEERIAEFKRALAQDVPEPVLSGPSLDWRSNFFEAEYREAIARTREYVAAGDIFQANIAQTFEAALPAGFDPFALYLKLRRTNAAPFGAFIERQDVQIASSSPERLLKVSDRRLETRPIKGTAPRSADPETDRMHAETLLASEKDRAENIMIVDLLRNDLSRIADPDSVEVPTLCGLESYAAVHHLVSVVTARLEDGASLTDAIGATFPGGSITGAPKIRAMEIITEIEKTRRGPYCGSIGYLGFDGSADLNIGIRTVTFEEGRARLAAGGGITILSDPAAEYEETFTKATRVFAAFEEER